MKSTSGATITVRKSAPEGSARRRLMAQAAWLMTFDDKSIVEVIATHDDGYSMPYLNSPRFPVSSGTASALTIIEVLHSAVWSRPASRSPDWVRSWSYIQSMRSPELEAWALELDFESEPLCDIHGDPTLENLLFAEDGTPVLTDPIPDAVLDGKIPSIRAVDMGKILQSALGYELVKRGLMPCWEWDGFIAAPIRWEARSDKEWEMAKFFAALNVARFIPYQTPTLKTAWGKWLPDIIAFLRVIDAQELPSWPRI